MKEVEEVLSLWLLVDSSLRQLFSGVPPSFSRSIKSLLLIRCSLLAESLASLEDLQVHICWFVMVRVVSSFRKDIMLELMR